MEMAWHARPKEKGQQTRKLSILNKSDAEGELNRPRARKCIGYARKVSEYRIVYPLQFLDEQAFENDYVGPCSGLLIFSIQHPTGLALIKCAYLGHRRM